MGYRTYGVRQSGFVLVVAVIFMTVLTLLSIVALRVSLLEERMTGNVRDRTIALEAAEAALRGAESYLNQAVLPNFDGTSSGEAGSNPGLFQRLFDASKKTSSNAPYDGGDINFWNDWNWSDACSTSKRCLQDRINFSSTDLGKPGYPAEMPKYVIEELPAIQVAGSSAKFGALPDTRAFRVTARGVGGTAGAVVILQSTYKR